MSEKCQNVQDVFLNAIRKSKNPVTVFLVNGVKLQGIVTWFDNFSILLRRDNLSQLVYKHAISTIMPSNPITALQDGDDVADVAASCCHASADIPAKDVTACDLAASDEQTVDA